MNKKYVSLLKISIFVFFQYISFLLCMASFTLPSSLILWAPEVVVIDIVVVVGESIVRVGG